MDDMLTWMNNHKDQLFRYLVYKRGFTPYEQEKKFVDESMFEDTHYNYGYIREIIALPNDYLIGFQDPYFKDQVFIEYFRLNEIRLLFDEKDAERLENGEL